MSNDMRTRARKYAKSKIKLEKQWDKLAWGENHDLWVFRELARATMVLWDARQSRIVNRLLKGE